MTGTDLLGELRRETYRRLYAGPTVDFEGATDIFQKHYVELRKRYSFDHYLVIYYNLDTKTNLEFSLMPPGHYVDVGLHNSAEGICFRRPQATHPCKDKENACLSTRCQPYATSSHFYAEAPDIKESPLNRWPWTATQSKELPFRTQFEHFLHEEFKKDLDLLCSTDGALVLQAQIFKAFNNVEIQPNGIRKGSDADFDSGNFSLTHFHQRNDLATKFYGCYLIAPDSDGEYSRRAALLLIYVDEYLPDDTATEELLALCSMMAWPALEREIKRDAHVLLLESVEHEQTKSKLEMAEAESRQFRAVQTDLDQLIGTIAQARSAALRVESHLSTSKEEFLKVYDDLKGLFEETRHWFYYVDGSGVSELFAEKKSGAEGEEKEIQTMHSSSSAGAGATFSALWKSYSEYLQEYCKRVNVPLLRAFQSSEDEETCRNLFSLLKILIQRPHMAPGWIYEVQLAIACAAATLSWRHLPSSVSVPTVSLCSLGNGLNEVHIERQQDTGLPDTLKLTDFIKGIKTLKRGGGEAMLSDKTRASCKVKTNCATALGALMRLVGSELRPREGPDVCLQRCRIEYADGAAEVTLECQGAFGQASGRRVEELLHLDERSSGRGLRSCLKVLCEAVGQEQVCFLDTHDITEIRRIRQVLPNSNFVLGTGLGSRPEDAKCVFNLRFERPQKTARTATTTIK